MKKIITIFILLIFCTVGFTQPRIGASYLTQSYYGFSGLTFIPTAQLLPAHHIGVSYTSKPSRGSDINLLPYSVRLMYGFSGGNFEVSATNTPFYSSDRIYNGVAVTHGVTNFETVIPVFPSVKYQIMPMSQANYQVAMAIGFALPYGGYYVVDKFVDIGLVDMTVHTGVATKLTTYHVFTGLTFTFGQRLGMIQRGFNLEMLVEAGWGGSLKQLDKKEEAFVAVSFRYAWTSALFITTFVRYDNQPLTENGEPLKSGPTTLMAVGLDYHLF